LASHSCKDAWPLNGGTYTHRDAMEKIKKTAERSKAEFMEKWNQKTTRQKCEYMLDIPSIDHGRVMNPICNIGRK